ncbi:hypothetical protein EYF80_049224 [Liparis tanakae]|uniref:Uncharacterized protein n=1 Tax=Liparis tanakae TaxID=230148 RepID=A0A4Z2FHB8_9TELE|nr:hypothetical protein EYF80_049224 [Liparis tanakae]
MANSKDAPEFCNRWCRQRELPDTPADLPGDVAFRADALDELAFLCHLAMGPFVMGMSSFRILLMQPSRRWVLSVCVLGSSRSHAALKASASGPWAVHVPRDPIEEDLLHHLLSTHHPPLLHLHDDGI